MAYDVLYDPKIGYYYKEPVTDWRQYNSPGVYVERGRDPYASTMMYSPFGAPARYFKNVPISSNEGQTAYTSPSVDFNALPRQTPAGVQIYGAGQAATPYQRPTAPPQNTGSGYRPQFDPTFIQQMLAQRFGNNQGAGIPTATRPVGPPTLTPGATQSYGGYQGQGGLGALRALANPAPVGGNTNAPV